MQRISGSFWTDIRYLVQNKKNKNITIIYIRKQKRTSQFQLWASPNGSNARLCGQKSRSNAPPVGLCNVSEKTPWQSRIHCFHTFPSVQNALNIHSLESPFENVGQGLKTKEFPNLRLCSPASRAFEAVSQACLCGAEPTAHSWNWLTHMYQSAVNLNLASSRRLGHKRTRIVCWSMIYGAGSIVNSMVWDHVHCKHARPTIGRLSAEHRPMVSADTAVGYSVGGMAVICRWRIGEVSVTSPRDVGEIVVIKSRVISLQLPAKHGRTVYFLLGLLMNSSVNGWFEHTICTTNSSQRSPEV